MSTTVQEVFQAYQGANANLVCFTGPGSCGGFSCAAAGGTISIHDSDTAANCNQTTNAIWQTFTPTAGTYYPAPAKLRFGLVALCSTGNFTLFGNKG